MLPEHALPNGCVPDYSGHTTLIEPFFDPQMTCAYGFDAVQMEDKTDVKAIMENPRLYLKIPYNWNGDAYTIRTCLDASTAKRSLAHKWAAFDYAQRN